MDKSLDRTQQGAPERKEKLNIRVIVADDDEAIMAIVARFLTLMGCTVETVENGQLLMERLTTAKPGEFGLVISDKEMPKMDGMQVLAQIRANDRLKDLPFILYSGNIEDDLETVRKSNAVYLEKPFTREKFFATVQRAVGGQSV